jgi:hypothetical protein
VSPLRRTLGRSAAALLGLALASGAAPLTGQQSLARQVESAPDGWVRFQYEAREGVCGNGRWISTSDDGGRGWRSDCDCSCEEGPVRVEMRVRGGEIRDIDTEVAGSWRDRSERITDLGFVDPEAAVELLFHIAETADEDVAEDAIFPATIARGVEVWPRLLEIAKGDAHRDVRRQAIFWLGQEASERATEGLTSIIESDDEIEVREHAIFALSQQRGAVDELIRIARTNREPKLKKQAIFWLGQQGDDPRVLQFLEDILTGGR